MDSRLIFLHRVHDRRSDTIEYTDRIIGFTFFVRRSLLGKSGRFLQWNFRGIEKMFAAMQIDSVEPVVEKTF